MLKRLIPFVIFIVLVVVLWFSLGENPHKIPSPLVNKKVPAFTAETLNNKVMTQQLLKGHVSLVNVFASWCMTCQAEHPILMEIAGKNKLPIYGIDYKDTKIDAKKFLSTYGSPYTTVLFDPNGTLGLKLGVYGTPETFIVDQHGVIRYKWIGAVSPRVWQDKLKPEIEKLAHE